MIWLVAVAALAAIGFTGFFPGWAEAVDVNVWAAEEPPGLFQEILQKSGWRPSSDRRYFIVSYMVRFRSLLPLGLDDLRGRVETPPAGVKTYLIHRWMRHATRFELIYLSADFLVEARSDQSPEELARNLDVALVSGRNLSPAVNKRGAEHIPGLSQPWNILRQMRMEIPIQNPSLSSPRSARAIQVIFR